MSRSYSPDKNILVTVDYDGEQHAIRTYTNEYRSLMMLIYDRIYTEDFGGCLGMGKCGTCRVEVVNKNHEPSAHERNEAVTLSKTGESGCGIRLSCQLIIDEHMDGLVVKVII